MGNRDLTQHDYGERWDHTDVRALLVRRKNGETIKQIAGSTGRSYWGVVAKLARLKVHGVDVSKGKKSAG